MIEWLSIGKGVAGLVKPLWNVLSKVARPTIGLAKAPKNILEHLAPASSPEHIRTVLGPPHKVIGSRWYYHFTDLLVQIDFWPGGGAKAIYLGLTGTDRKHRFPVPVCAKQLGQLTLADVKRQEDSFVHRSSLRHEEVIISYRIGPAGARGWWTFGAMSAVGARFLHESFFTWDTKADALQTNPAKVLVNWVAISDSGDDIFFDWSVS